MISIKSVVEASRDWAGQRGIPVECQSVTESTNDDAKRAASRETRELVLHLAEHQSAGKGRNRNTWIDTGTGECFLSSWSLAVPTAPQAISGPRVGLALFSAMARAWPSVAWSLKAPNDLCVDGKKVGGILLESVSSGPRHRFIVGIGLNVLNHPRGLANVSHVAQALARAPDSGDWFRFLDALLAQLNAATADCLLPELTVAARQELKSALNANSNRTFEVLDVLGTGDLRHAGGTVIWRDL